MPETRNRILVVGAGFVGLATATFLAQRGYPVTAVDRDPEIVRHLNRGKLHFHEPDLAGRLKKLVAGGSLVAAEPTAEDYARADWIFIAIDSVDSATWKMRRKVFQTLARLIGNAARSRPATVVMRSTNILGFAERFRGMLDATPHGAKVDLVVNPEFLREGHAYEDTASPSRVVVGVQTDGARRRAVRLMKSLYGPRVPLVVTDWRSAELIKLGANLYLSHRLAFIHEIAEYAHRYGLDMATIRDGIGLDPRIGLGYFEPGLGFGGSCLPKDARLINSAESRNGMDFLTARTALAVNRRVLDNISDTLKAEIGSLRGKRIAILGAAFKPETDDIRNSRALALADRLCECGARIAVYDPYVTVRRVSSDVIGPSANSAVEAAREASVVVIGTAHKKFRSLRPESLAGVVRRKLVVDRFRILNRKRWEAVGFRFL